MDLVLVMVKRSPTVYLLLARNCPLLVIDSCMFGEREIFW